MKYFAPLLAALVLIIPAAAGADAKVTTTSSGLRYSDAKVGDGTEAVPGKDVAVHYTGWLLMPGDQKGKKFDSSIDRGSPIRFTLGQGRVIQGWEEGLKGMKSGGKRTLYIPSALAYGPRAVGADIPANSNLIFDVELVEVAK